MVIVSAWRSAQHNPGLAAVARSIHGDVGHINRVGIGRVDGEFLEVPAAAPERRIGGETCPCLTGVIRSKESALPRRRTRRTRSRWRGLRRRRAERRLDLGTTLGHQAIDDRVDSIWICRRHCDARPADSFIRQSAGQPAPVVTAVGRFEDPAARTIGGRVGEPGWTAGVPESRVDESITTSTAPTLSSPRTLRQVRPPSAE